MLKETKIFFTLTLIWVVFLGIRFEVAEGRRVKLPPLSKTC